MTEPTDDEIAACIEAAQVKCVHPDAKTTIEIARAVLAKWGQSAHSGEPVAWLSPWRADQVTTDYDAYGKHGIPLYTAPQPLPAAQGDALSDEAVRVPLDSLHADAAYLIGRLREGSMPYARAIEIIRERIDAAKAAIRARAPADSVLEDAARYRAFIECGQPICFMGEEYYGKAALDAAIDAARKQGGQHGTE